MISFKQVLLLSVVLIGLVGCVIVINGISQDYKIVLNFVGVKVYIIGGSECVMLCEFNFKWCYDFCVDIMCEGYKLVYVLVWSCIGGVMVGNIFMGGLIGGVVDGSNGVSNYFYLQLFNVKLVVEGFNDEVVLLDKNGKQISIVVVYNKFVQVDVVWMIGKEVVGLVDVVVVMLVVVVEFQFVLVVVVLLENSVFQGDVLVSIMFVEVVLVVMVFIFVLLGLVVVDVKQMFRWE